MGMVSLGGAAYELTANSAPLIQEMSKAEQASKKSVEAISKATGILEKDVARLANTYLREEKRRAEASAQATLKVVKSYNDAADAADKAAAKAAASARGSESAFLGGAKSALGFGVALVGIGGAAETARRGISAVYTATKELEQAQFAVNKLYGGGAKEITAFSEQLAESSGRSKQEALAAAAAVANLGRQYAFTSEQQKNLLKISADLAAIKGLTLEQATSRVADAMRGEAEAAEYLGQTLGNDAVQAFAKMTDEQRKHFDTLDPITKAQITYGKLVKDNADLTGVAADRLKTLGGSTDNLKGAMSDLGATLGSSVAPGLIEIQNAAAGATKSFTGLLQEGIKLQQLGQPDNLRRLEAIAKAIAGQPGDLVQQILQGRARQQEQEAAGGEGVPFGPSPTEVRDAIARYEQLQAAERDAIRLFVDERTKAIKTVAEAQEKAAQDEAKRADQAIEREKIRLEVEQEGRLKALDERQRTTIAAIEAEAEAAKKASAEAIQRAEREKDSKLAAVDQAHDRVVAAINAEQDALDAAREVEDRARDDERQKEDQDLADFRARQDAEVQAAAEALQKRRALEDQARVDRRAAEDRDRQDRRAADDRELQEAREREDRKLQEDRDREDKRLAFAAQVIAMRREMETRAIAARREAEDRALAAQREAEERDIADRRTREVRELADARAAEDKQLEALHNVAMARLDQQHQAALKALDDEADAARRAHADRMRDLDDQARAEDDRHRKAMRAIEAESDAKLRAIDEELRRLDAADEAENNAARDRQLADAVENARFGLLEAQSSGNQSRIVQAEQELTDALDAIRRERGERERDAARASLRTQQQSIKDKLAADLEAERERNRLREQEIEDAQEAARTILDSQLASIKERQEAEQAAYDQRAAQLRSEFEAVKERIARQREEEDRARADRWQAEDRERQDRLAAEALARQTRRAAEDLERQDRLAAEDRQLQEHRQRIADRRRDEERALQDRRRDEDRDRSDRRLAEDREIADSRQAQDRRRSEERAAEDVKRGEEATRLRLRREDEDRALDARRLAEDRSRQDYRAAEDKKLTDQLAAAKATQELERAAVNEHFHGPNGVLNQIRTAMENAQTEYQNRLNDAKRTFEQERAEIRAIYRNTAKTGLLDLQDEAAKNNREKLADQLSAISSWKQQANEFIEDNKGKWKDLTEAINATSNAIRNLPQTNVSVPRPPSSGGSSGGSAPGAPPAGSIPGPDPGMPGGTNPGGGIGSNPAPGQQPPASSVPGPGGPWGVTFPFNAPYNGPYAGGAAWPGGPPNHRGVDLKLPGPDNGRGTTFGAFDGGQIVGPTNDPAGGIGVIVAADSGKYNYYGHLDQLLKGSGRINKGEPLGVLGRTGLESGIQTHLHYEVRRGINGDPPGQLSDPMPFVRGMANGGVIREPIYGIGASGQRYMFGENTPREPEVVIPKRAFGGGRPVPGAQFTMPDVAGQVAASAQLALSASAAAASSSRVIHTGPIYLGGRLLADLWIDGKEEATNLGRNSVTRSSYKTGGSR